MKNYIVITKDSLDYIEAHISCCHESWDINHLIQHFTTSTVTVLYAEFPNGFSVEFV